MLNSTRQRILEAALDLFTAQGVNATPTRQVAESAGVNEVTLFRHFGNKVGLLLAVIEQLAAAKPAGELLGNKAADPTHLVQMLTDYAQARMQTLEPIPGLIRSLMGDSDPSSPALGQQLARTHQELAQYLAAVTQPGELTPEQMASLFNSILFASLLIEFSSDFNRLWPDRSALIISVIKLFCRGSGLASVEDNIPLTTILTFQSEDSKSTMIQDLPANFAHQIMRNARKFGSQEYAIAYLLWGAGLTVAEIVSLERSHSISDTHHHLIQVINPQGTRQVPINQWILGKRYGSYTHNPLTQWLKSRKDQETSLFLNPEGSPFSEPELEACWQQWSTGLLAPTGKPPQPIQAHQTWCLEMVMRGISLENLSILTGKSPSDLQPYLRRAQEKSALEQAIQLDQKSLNT